MTIIISLSRSVIRHSRKATTVYLPTCCSRTPPFCKRPSAIQFQLVRYISSIGISHLDESLHSDIAKIKPYWKKKKNLQSRYIRIPNEELQYFISRQLKKNKLRYFGSDVLILFRDRENPPHFVIVAQDEGIQQAEKQIQTLLNEFKIKNIPLPDNEYQLFISRLLIGKKKTLVEDKFKVFVLMKNQGASLPTEDTCHVSIMSESAEDLKLAAEYMIHQINELQQKLNIKNIPLPDDEHQVYIIRWLCQEQKKFENKFRVLISLSAPTEDQRYVAVTSESEENVSKAEKFLKHQIEKLKWKLNIKHIFLPDYEYQNFIIRSLANKHKTFENRFNVMAVMRGRGTSSLSEDPPHVMILSESEYNVKKAGEFMEHHIDELVRKLNMKKIFFPDNEYQHFIFRLLAQNLKTFEDRFEVLAWINASALTKDAPHVVMMSESEENVKKAAACVEHYMQDSQQTLKIMNIPLPYNELHFIVRLLEDKQKTFEEEFKVLIWIKGEGTSFPTADPPHAVVVCESEENVKKAVKDMQYFIQNEYIRHFIEKNVKKHEIPLPHALDKTVSTGR